MTEQNEPSMEDILASIRNILADEEDKAKDVADKQPESSAADGKKGGVVDLTADMIVNETQKAKAAMVETPEEAIDDDFTPEPVIPRQPMKEETLNDLIQEKQQPSDDDVLMSRPTIEAAAHSLSGLREFAAE